MSSLTLTGANNKINPIKIDIKDVDKVNEILHEVIVGDRKLYPYLLLQIESYFKLQQAENLILLFTTLNECVSVINEPHHTEIISLILQRFTWLYNQNVMDVFTGFLLNLISAHGNLVGTCFRHLVRKFILETSSNPSPVTKPVDIIGGIFNFKSTTPIVNHEENYKLVSTRIHSLFQKIIALVPSSVSNLSSILSSNFPHHARFEHGVLRLYALNILETTRYCTSIRDKIYEIIIDKMIQMDVMIMLDETPDDEELIFDVDLDKERIELHKAMAEKLDSLMEVMLSFIDENYLDPNIFLQFIHIFDTKILPTFKSKYTQFIIFYFCSKNSSYSYQFLGYLLNKLRDVAVFSLTRQACASYIGSFLSRANYLDEELFKKSIAILTDWIHQYMDSNAKSKIPDVDSHGLFYSVTQSLIYALCFHNQKQPIQIDYFNQLDIDRVITSPLNPLKFISKDLIHEFNDKIAIRLNITTVSSVMKKNDSLMLLSRASLGGNNHLESFFPFDPYLLKNSSSKINLNYNNWNIESQKSKKQKLQQQQQLQQQQTSSSPSSAPTTSSPPRATPQPLSSSHQRISQVKEMEIISPPSSVSVSPSMRDDSMISENENTPTRSRANSSMVETPIDISGMSLEENDSHLDLQFHFHNAVEV